VAVTQYLSRSVSAFYAMFGGLTILVSLDVRRFGPVITYLAIATMAFGMVITGVDVIAKMPTPPPDRLRRVPSQESEAWPCR
jgi:hypothetical protein